MHNNATGWKGEALEMMRRAAALEGRCEALQEELGHMAACWAQERAALLDDVAALQQELALKNLLVASFIPPHEVDKILQRAVWDVEAEEWRLQPQPDQQEQRPLAAWRRKQLHEQQDVPFFTPRPGSDYAITEFGEPAEWRISPSRAPASRVSNPWPQQRVSSCSVWGTLDPQ
eukprot:jgi/Botrbrau1/4520/Bobra.60_2s0011.1